ncbi:MAG: hypothetical protein KC912_23485 [Proteobacteria bacterium]|nr:hypothetical protein [Pseudomonadota bacterium]
MKRTLALSVLLLVVTVGCDELTTGDCDTSAVSSVTVSVVDADGLLTPADSVTYEVDGSSEADCEPLMGDGTEWTCGVEESGDFYIRAYVGSAVYTGEVSVGMQSDGCHVQAQFIDIATF